MKICILTVKLDEKDGVGRYSIEMLRSFKKLGVDTMIITEGILPSPLSYNKNYFLAPWYAWKVRKMVKDCDTIHTFSEPYSYIAYWLSRFSRKKYFVTAHGTYGIAPYFLGWIKKYFHKKSFAEAERVVCVSNYTKRRLMEFGLENLYVIHNGIDFKKFYQPFDFNNKKNYLLSVGALKPRKGYHVSIKAFAMVQKALPDLKYIIVGNQNDNLYFSSLKEIASNLSVKDKIEFRDNLSHEQLLALYKEAKLFVLTSVSEGPYFEGFGLVYLEAGASGMPVIGSLDTGAEDAIKDNNTGSLVPQNNLNLLAESILGILGDSNLYQRMSNSGIMWSRDHDWDNVAPKYIEMYKQI